MFTTLRFCQPLGSVNWKMKFRELPDPAGGWLGSGAGGALTMKLLLAVLLERSTVGSSLLPLTGFSRIAPSGIVGDSCATREAPPLAPGTSEGNVTCT